MKAGWLALVVAPLPALAAEPWEGVWAHDPAWCVHADKIGWHDPAPVRLTAGVFEGLENRCEVLALRGRPEASFWEVTLSCAAEGEIYEAAEVLMLQDADTLWHWFGGGEPVRFTRCKGG